MISRKRKLFIFAVILSAALYFSYLHQFRDVWTNKSLIRPKHISSALGSLTENYEKTGNILFPLKPDSRLTCLHGIVTFIPGGRLANQIFEYASACYLAEILGYRCLIPEETFKDIQVVYTNISTPILEDEIENGLCKGNNISAKFVFDKGPKITVSLNLYRQWAKQYKQPIILWKWANIVEIVAPNFKEVLKLFHTRPDVERGANEVLQNIRRTQVKKYIKDQITFIGIHVRRTDMTEFLKRSYGVKVPAGVNYYRHAVADMRKYLSENESQILAFVLASDDVEWCKVNIIPELQKDLEKGWPRSDIFLADDGSFKSPSHDLITLSMCNHSIITYGTFGMWLALKAGGRTIVYDVMNNNPKAIPIATTRALQYLPNWIALS